MPDPKKEADKLRQEAKDLLNNLFCDALGLSRSDYVSGVDRIVDCIISAAVLEIADTQKQALKPQKESANSAGVSKGTNTSFTLKKNDITLTDGGNSEKE